VPGEGGKQITKEFVWPIPVYEPEMGEALHQPRQEHRHPVDSSLE
jgi:hypothetical protein